MTARGWGHGYATEAATGWLDHAFGPLGLPRVISITDRPNLRSLAVMRRLGMEFDHEAEIEDMGQVFQAVVYSITAIGHGGQADGVVTMSRRRSALSGVQPGGRRTAAQPSTNSRV
jgi:hypothetical protein